MHKKMNLPIDQIRQWIEVEKKTHSWVSEQVGCSNQHIARVCKKHNIKTQRTGPRSGKGHPGWGDGTYLCKGYRYVYSPNHPNKTKQGYVAEHRLVMEKSLGRYLRKKEVVHHIDGNPLNNNIKNLVLFSRNSEHLKAELSGKSPNWTPEGFANMCKKRPRWLKNADYLAKYGDDPLVQELLQKT